MASSSNFTTTTTTTITTTTSPVSQTSEIPSSSAGHSRNLSTVSSNTLHTAVTNTTLHSTPYEPLLPPILSPESSSDAPYEVVSSSRRSRPSPILSLARWSQSNMRSAKHSSSSSPKNLNEKKKVSSLKEDRLSPPLSANLNARRLKLVKRVLEVILVVWSIYSMGRYLFAFTIYESVTGQLATLFLGICTGLSFAFTSCSIILSLAQKHLLIRGFSVHALLSIRSTLQYLSTMCFLGPSIVNFVLLVVWRNSFDPEIQFNRRCKLDVDLVWTITYSLCENIGGGNSWGVWVTLAVVRIVLTIFTIIAFHFISNSQIIFIPKSKLHHHHHHHVKGSKSHKRLHSNSNPSLKVSPSPSSSLKESGDASGRNDDPALLNLLSTERSFSSSSIKSSPRHRLRSTQSRLSSEGVPSYSHQDFLLSMGSSQTDPTFIERFRSMISQVSQETDEGLAYARASYTSCQSRSSADSPTSPDMDMDVETLHGTQYDPYRQYEDNEGDDFEDGDEEDDFYASSSTRHEVVHHHQHSDDYQQQQQNYPAEEQHVRVMNGYIKRMPTIESMGSRELLGSLGSAGASSSLNTNRNGSPRPPTRPNTVISWNGTDVSGSGDVRRRSLTAQAELLVGLSEKNNDYLSEIGELVRPEEMVKLVVVDSSSSGTSGGGYPNYDSSTSTSEGSKGSIRSFHTAHNGDYASDSLTSISVLAEATTNTGVAMRSSSDSKDS